MRKRIGFTLSILLALFLILPSGAGAEEAKGIEGLKATVNNAAKQVTIEGNVQSGTAINVTLRVFDPKDEIDYIDQIKSADNGKFSFVFTLSHTLTGTYTAYVGAENLVQPEMIKFDYKEEGSNGPGENGGNDGGGSGTDTVPPADTDLFQLQADGSIKAVISTKLEQNGVTAVGALSEQDLNKGLAKAKADQKGMKKAIVELKENQGATKYAFDLPASFLSANANITFEVRTPQATVVLPGNMLQKTDITGKQFRFIIAKGDLAQVKESVKNQIGDRPVIELLAEIDGKVVHWSNSAAPLTVKVAYTPSAGEDSGRIGALSLMDQGKVETVSQAAFITTDKIVQFQTNHTGRYAVAYTDNSSMGSFEDLAKYPWAQEAIEKLAAKGIVKGTSATTFSPAQQVSRADFILMLVRGLDLKADADSSFSDVQTTDYYYEAVGIAQKLGIVTGVNSSQFNPKDKISRQDMMVMAARALEVSGKEIQGKAEDLASYKDAGKVADYAVSSVADLITKGLIQGDGDLIHPHSQATRAETAVFVYRMLNL